MRHYILDALIELLPIALIILLIALAIWPSNALARDPGPLQTSGGLRLPGSVQVPMVQYMEVSPAPRSGIYKVDERLPTGGTPGGGVFWRFHSDGRITVEIPAHVHFCLWEARGGVAPGRCFNVPQ